MESLDYGKGYRYAHDEEGAVSDMDCLPPGLIGRKYYQPTDRGREKMLQQRMEEIEQLRKEESQIECEVILNDVKNPEGGVIDSAQILWIPLCRRPAGVPHPNEVRVG